MTNTESIMRLNLQLFGEGNGAEGTGETGTVAASQGANSNNPLAGMIYGKQAEAEPTSPAQEETVTPEQLSAEFKELTKGKYKDAYNSSVESIVKQRLKGTKEQVARLEALAPTLELLAQKYGVDVNDIEALNKAIDDDDTFFADEASQRGISVAELKNIRKLERENEMLKRANREVEDRKKADALYNSWMQQAEEVKNLYPSFDLNEELKNPEFIELLKSPAISVRRAFEVLHMDELTASAMHFAAQNTKNKLASSIAANGNRPSENGVSSVDSQRAKRDVASLTKADIDEINRRVMRGEIISF